MKNVVLLISKLDKKLKSLHQEQSIVAKTGKTGILEQLLSDYQTMLASKKQHTSSLFLLRSSMATSQPEQVRMNRLGKSHYLLTQSGQLHSLPIPPLENRIEILLIAPR